VKTGIQASYSSDGSPPTTCGDDGVRLSFPTFSIGNPSWSFSDGSPPTTCGDDRRGRIFTTHCGDDRRGVDTCNTHADMTKERWIPA
jgi:hypothetical protein